MKKLFLTAITIVSMAFVSYAGNVDVNPLNTNGGELTVEKDGPHTKQYLDLKEVLDRYERDIKGATSCADLDDAYDSFFSSILIMQFDSEYDYDESEQMTEEESTELKEQGDRIDLMIAQKNNQFGCETEESAPEMIPTTTEDWDNIIAEYEILLSKLEALRKQNLDVEQNLNGFLEITQEHVELLDRLERSDESTVIERQHKRLMEINDRIAVLTREMGLVE